MELDKVPGYSRALARGYSIEESMREQSYLGISEKICGVAISTLSLQTYLQLVRVNSPFVCGGRPLPHDVAFFLFRISPAYDKARAAKAAAEKPPTFIDRIFRPRYSRQSGSDRGAAAFKKVRREFVEQVRGIPFHISVRAIRRFVKRMLLDKPPNCRGASGEAVDTSLAADIIHWIAGAYGWRRDEILALPMPEIFQALRKIQRDLPQCPKRIAAKAHPIAARFTRRHVAIAEKAALDASTAIAG